MNLPSVALALTGLGLTAMLLNAAWTDLRMRRVENRAVVGIAALWPVYLIAVPAENSLTISLLLAGLTLGVGVLLWRRGWLGGGDVKLLTVLTLWAGPRHGLDLIVVTALAGGALAGAALWYRAIGFALLAPLASLIPGTLHDPRLVVAGGNSLASLPYAVAIAIGGLWVTAPLFLA